MDELRKVIDYESQNECDICGQIIEIGEIYFASPDDRDIVCQYCHIPEGE